MKYPGEIKKGRAYYNQNRTTDLEFTTETNLFSVDIETQGNDLFIELNIAIRINAANANVYADIDDTEFLIGTTSNTSATIITPFTRIISGVEKGKHTVTIKARPSQAGRTVTFIKYLTTSMSVIEL